MPFFRFQNSLGTPFCSLLGLIWLSWGGLETQKMQTVLCKKHFFENRIFRFLGIYLALFGSSRRLPGRSWRQNGTQNGRESEPESCPKSVPKLDPILSSSWTNFGAHFGVQNGAVRGTLFSRFSRAPFWPHVCSILAPSWPHLGPSWPLLAPSWPLLALSWPHVGPILAPLSLSWRPLGPVLAPSWHHGGPSWLHLVPV